MFKKVTQQIILSLAFIAFLADSSFIQLTAWATMLPSRYLESGSLSDAVESTFSGDEPCPLCRLAKETQEQEHEEEPTVWKSPPLVKIVHSSDSTEFFVPLTLFLDSSYRPKNEVHPARSERPNAPPPKSLFV